MTIGSAVAAFFAGMFLANFVPHFVKGICGDRFPTPFAKPPGKGLSSATVNVAWSLVNLIAAFFLFRIGRVGSGELAPVGICFAGAALLSLQMSSHFQHKDKE
ncbi:hypothetical protein SAMN05421819_0674 [Bryocella elongata]|uniref:Uncharacterized protein n=1 Tax=Bryocella elongata TaxID=863522 RepID=A0A1H5TPV7_9BACT|nr:hypothetical protein [Bryocella elongata]SEF64121.1 hypothetical protein SAMN05421819_0674 [Bryocella elongata]